MRQFIVDICSPYVVVILAGTFLSIFINRFLNGFDNMKLDLKKRLDEFMALHPLVEKLYDRDKLEEKIRYNQTFSFYCWMERGCNSPIEWLFFLFGGSAALIYMMTQITPFCYPVQIALASIASSFVFHFLLSTPFELISDKIEKQYGYSNLTMKLYVSDKVKGFLVSSAMTLGAVTAGYYVLVYLGKLNYLTVFAVIAAWRLYAWSVNVLDWYVIMPLFNKYTHLEDGSLKDRLQKMVESYGYKLGDVRVVDESKRSNKGNAYCMNIPFGPKKIVLYDTLIKQLSEEEIVAVFAHELGHEKLHHNFIGFIISFAEQAFFLWLAVYFIYKPEMYHAVGMRWVTEANIVENSIIGITILSQLTNAVEWIFEPALACLSRKHEYAADKYAVQTMGSAEPLITALVKLEFESGGDVAPSRAWHWWYGSHPMLVDRVKALREDERQLHAENVV